jgi:hypothetical protein
MQNLINIETLSQFMSDFLFPERLGPEGRDQANGVEHVFTTNGYSLSHHQPRWKGGNPWVESAVV